MAHLIETHAYAGNTPWHGLGVQVSNDLTPDQMLTAAGLDWRVGKYDMYLANGKGLGKRLEKQALVRMSDMKELSIVSNSWNPVQNSEAFEFFNDFVLSGNMEMHTAGSLKEGKMVWALAKVKESFSIFGGDEVDSYLLFSNPHEFGKTVDVRFVNTRVVCMNTLSWALKEKSKSQVKLNHSRKFNGEFVKETLGISKDNLEMMKQQSLFLGSKRYTKESLTEYFKTVFPGNTKKELSKNAVLAIDNMEKQPGAKFAEGTFYQALNSVTYLTNHVLGRNTDNRLYSLWYGANANVNQIALKTAIKFAEAA